MTTATAAVKPKHIMVKIGEMWVPCFYMMDDASNGRKNVRVIAISSKQKQMVNDLFNAVVRAIIAAEKIDFNRTRWIVQNGNLRSSESFKMRWKRNGSGNSSDPVIGVIWVNPIVLPTPPVIIPPSPEVLRLLSDKRRQRAA